MKRLPKNPNAPPTIAETAHPPTPREVRLTRETAIKNLDKTIKSLSAALATREEPVLDQLLKDTIIIRSEFYHLQIDWASISMDMTSLKRRLAALNQKLEDWMRVNR